MCKSSTGSCFLSVPFSTSGKNSGRRLIRRDHAAFVLHTRVGLALKSAQRLAALSQIFRDDPSTAVPEALVPALKVGAVPETGGKRCTDCCRLSQICHALLVHFCGRYILLRRFERQCLLVVQILPIWLLGRHAPSTLGDDRSVSSRAFSLGLRLTPKVSQAVLDLREEPEDSDRSARACCGRLCGTDGLQSLGNLCVVTYSCFGAC